jgi:type I restriction enzyme S subunit
MTVTLWKPENLSDLADMCLGKMLDQNKNKGNYFPYLANTNVRWGHIELDNLREMKFEPKEFDRYGLEPGDIVMCEGGEPGRCAIWKGQTASMMIQKALHRIRAKEGVSSVFLYYILLNKGVQGHYEAYFTGAAIKHLTGESLAKIKVLIPPLPTQQKIAHILSAYDDLIENNLKRIKLLEEMAQITYEEWFVRMKFPGHEQAVIDSETGLPEGWEKGVLGDLVGFLSGFAFKSSDFIDSGNPVIKIKNIGYSTVDVENTDFVSSSVAEKAVSFALEEGDLLIAMTGATIGKVGVVPYSDNKCYLNQRVGMFTKKTIDNLGFAFCLLSCDRGYQQILNFAAGAAQPNISGKQVLCIETNIPNDEVLDEFSNIINPIFAASLNFRKLNQRLKEARGILLPRLMTGMIDVNTLDLPEPIEREKEAVQ